jgi:hypothetical protein
MSEDTEGIMLNRAEYNALRLETAILLQDLGLAALNALDAKSVKPADAVRFLTLSFDIFDGVFDRLDAGNEDTLVDCIMEAYRARVRSNSTDDIDGQ